MNAFIEFVNLWGERAVNFAWPMLWQSSLLIAALFAFDFMFRRKIRASVRYALWLVVFVKLLLPPSLALPTSLAWWVRPSAPVIAPAKQEQTTTLLVTYKEVVPATAPIFAEPTVFAPIRPSLSTGGWAALGWAAICLGLFAWLLVRWWQVARNVRSATFASERLHELLVEVQIVTGVSRRVELRLTTRAMSPAVCGLFRPAILLPQSLVHRLSAEQLRAVLLHELIHLRRGDVWVNCVQALLQMFYWWHPMLWLANARIRRVREEAVDDAVMLALADKSETYAPTLLEVAKLAFNRPLATLGLVGILESRSALRQRIERLMNFRPPRKAGLTIVSALCVLAFAALAVPMEKAPAPTERPQTQTATDLPQDERKRDSVERTNSVTKNGLSTTNLIYTTKGRQRIIERLNTTRLEQLSYSGTTLEKVVRDLTEESKKRDSQKRGVNFIINPTIEPLEQTAEPIDVKSLQITIEPALTDLRLADVLNAIVGATGSRVKYTIEDYAVVFSQSIPGVEPLYTRTFKVNAARFFKNLQEQGYFGALSSEQQSDTLYQQTRDRLRDVMAIQSLISSSGVDLNPLLGKSVFWNDRSGVLLVRATMHDLDVVEKALAKMLAVGTEPGNVRRAEAAALVQNDRVLFEAGKLDEAEVKLNEAITIDSSNRAAPFYLNLVNEVRSRKDESQPGPFEDPLKKGEQLFIRTFKVPPDVNLRIHSSSLSGGVKTNLMEEVSIAVQSFFRELGVDLDPLLGKSVSWNFREGTLRVMGTKQDLDLIERALADFPTKQQNATPPTSTGATNASADGSVPARQTKDKVPVLGDVPLRGRFFRNESNSPPDKVGTNHPARPETLYTRTFKVNPNTILENLRAVTEMPPANPSGEDLKRALTNFFGTLGVDLQPPHSIFYNDRHGMLLVRSTMSQLDAVEQAVQVLNVSAAQINIKARFVEMPEAVAESIFAEMYLTNRGSLAGWSVVIPDAEMRRFLKQLEAQEGVDLLTFPEVTTLSGRQAQVQAVDMKTVVSSTNGVLQTNMVPCGSVLDVFPVLGTDGYTIQITAIPNVTEFLGYDDPGMFVQKDYVAPPAGKTSTSTFAPLPRFRVRQTMNSAVLWDGQTLIVGGLSATNALRLKHKVPVLGDLPLAGRLFRSESPGTETKTLVVFITPTLMDPAGNRVHSDDELPFAKDSIPSQAPAQK